MGTSQIVVLNKHNREHKICGARVIYRKIIDPFYPYDICEELTGCNNCSEALSIEDTVPSGNEFVLNELERRCASCGRNVLCRQIADPLQPEKIHEEFIMKRSGPGLWTGFPEKVHNCGSCGSELSLSATSPALL